VLAALARHHRKALKWVEWRPVVEVDRESGAVRLRDYVSVDDCGVRISPMPVAGQVHGGLAQGIAQALWEDLVYDAHGQLSTGSLMEYTTSAANGAVSR